MNAALALRIAGLVYGYTAFHIGNQYLATAAVDKFSETQIGKKTFDKVGNFILSTDAKVNKFVKKSFNGMKNIIAKTSCNPAVNGSIETENN